MRPSGLGAKRLGRLIRVRTSEPFVEGRTGDSKFIANLGDISSLLVSFNPGAAFCRRVFHLIIVTM